MSKVGAETPKKLTIPEIRARRAGPNLVMVACYDYPMARICERAGVDMLLVGDSLGMVALGYDSTVPVTLQDILHHCRAVVRGAPNTHVVADMPFLTYQIDRARTVENAGLLIQEGGADSVKLEGGRNMAPMIEALVTAGIPVVAHIGLLPQRANELGGFKVQGKDLDSAKALIEDAQAVVAAGAFAMVIEAVPAALASLITERSSIPTIGIGAGASCSGQVLLSHDLLGVEDRMLPRFVKRYADVGTVAFEAISAYAEEVRSGEFPSGEHTYAISDEVIAAIRAEVGYA
jgi:3-methyl-2-oxobutanoate hydroxymethyltransferase